MPEFYPSGPIAIRDATWSRVKAIPAFNGNVFRLRTMPIKEDAIPFATVWQAGEETTPLGGANSGPPKFEHRLVISVNIVVKAPTDEELDDVIVPLTELVRGTLLSDYTWIDVCEGIEACNTRYEYPADSESLLVRSSIQFTLTYKSIWEPVVPNDLNEVAVRTPYVDDQLVIRLSQHRTP